MHPSASRLAFIAAALLVSACSDGPIPLDPAAPGPPPTAVPAAATQDSDQASRHQRLARRVALALRDDEFRAILFRSLQASPEREGKVHLQRLLGGGRNVARQRLAALAGETEAAIGEDLERSAPIEMYLPVPEHRVRWRGGTDVLVATAEADRDAPIAFDIQGGRRLLDPVRAPATPVIALGRAELGFRDPGLAASTCFFECEEDPVSDDFGSGAPSITPGLYMTYAIFTETFEGWLKGSPEFEVHILGQDGSSTSMKSYQCAGQAAGAPYQYDQNEKQWSGTVMLFSQTQLDAYKAAHPGQSVRVFLLEDDDDACIIKMDSTRVSNLFKALKTVYGDLTGGKDEKLFSIKTFTKAASLFSFLRSAWSVITTQDDLIGNAVEDVVAREYYPGANWIVKGENTATKGAIRLEMR